MSPVLARMLASTSYVDAGFVPDGIVLVPSRKLIDFLFKTRSRKMHLKPALCLQMSTPSH